MKQIKKLLEFDTIEDVPQDFSCCLCGDFWGHPKQIVENYKKLTCSERASDQFRPRSSFKCQLCFKKINAQKYFKHNLKCQIIYRNSLNFQKYFQIISDNNDDESIDKQKLQIDLSRQNQDVNQKQSITLKDQQDKQQQDFSCNKCSQLITEKESYYHFKKCIFDQKYQDLNISDEMIKSVQFFTEFKKFCKMFQLNPEQYQETKKKRKYIFDSLVEQYYQEKKRCNLIKKLNKMLEYLKKS